MPELLLNNNIDSPNIDFLLHIESIRKVVNEILKPTTKEKFGQYMTPIRIASFMASLFSKTGP